MRLLLFGSVLPGLLILSHTPLIACELPPRPANERRLVFALEPQGSLIQFEGDARLHTFTGTARKLTGRIRLADASLPSEAEACVEIEAASITTGIDLRDETMRKNHLHTGRFPTILFTMTGVEQVRPLGADQYTGALRGMLTLHSVTSPLVVPAKAHITSTWLSVEGQVPLRLSTFEIPIPSFLFIRMKDEVIVRYKVKATRQ